MLKKFLFVLMVFIISSCTAPHCKNCSSERLCPIIEVKQDTMFFSNYSLELSLKGYEGFCYYDDNTKHTIARINPVFKIRRINDGNENDIHFAFYTETLQGPPEYLGHKTYRTHIALPDFSGTQTIKGKTVEIRIPKGMENTFSINMGLVFNKRNKI